MCDKGACEKVIELTKAGSQWIGPVKKKHATAKLFDLLKMVSNRNRSKNGDISQLVVGYFSSGKFTEALYTHNEYSKETNSLLWIKPEVNDIYWLQNNLKNRKIISIGCGTGFFEYVINKLTDIKVFGVELDLNYWKSNCPPAQFLELLLPNDFEFNMELNSCESSLLFCYFNNMQSFRDYVEIFRGNTIIIIGPEIKGRYTEPSPLNSGLDLNIWKLNCIKEIRHSGDFIAIYQMIDV